jgi:hypothetical protein
MEYLRAQGEKPRLASYDDLMLRGARALNFDVLE